MPGLNTEVRRIKDLFVFSHRAADKEEALEVKSPSLEKKFLFAQESAALRGKQRDQSLTTSAARSAW